MTKGFILLQKDSYEDISRFTIFKDGMKPKSILTVPHGHHSKNQSPANPSKASNTLIKFLNLMR